MAEVSKVMYIVVVDDDDEDEEGNYRKKKKIEKMSVENESFRYTRPILQSTLQLMGCKPRHAFKISKRVFGTMTSQSSKDVGLGRFVPSSSLQHTEQELVMTSNCLVQPETDASFIQTKEQESAKNSSELYRKRTTVVVGRDKFLDVVCDALAEYKYVGPKQRGDLFLACRIRERKESVTVLLCGTSGCGKSTLSSLLASRLGITTVVSTDSIRHMMRSFVDEQQNPLLWASTYHAGECLDPNAVAEANIRRKARKKAGVSHSFSKEKLSECIWNEKCQSLQQETVPSNTEQISEKQMAVEGFKAQSEMVIESLDRLITSWEERKESVIVEGVHLSLNFVMGLMKRHPSIIPFMIYITNEDKHLERFAVRAKYMTLDPARNKYVKYIKNIRRIQEYLCKRADKHLVPKINNTNVDKSVATIHATVFSSLRRRIAGEQLYDPTTNTVTAIYDEYRNQCAADSWSSKGMFRLLHGKGAPRHLMAFVNADGSIARAWPITPTDRIGMPSKPALGHESDSMIGTTISGFLQNGKAEPVNLHFGHFGVSAWPRDTGGSSRAGSVDESRTDLTNTETGSRCFSSCCSSPHMSDRPTKGHMAEVSVLGSDDEVDDQPEPGSEEDFSDGHKHYPEEMEGSIDEESTKSNEEYDDLAMQDDQEDGYWHDEDKDLRQALSAFLTNSKEECNISPTLDMFLRTQRVPVCQQMA